MSFFESRYYRSAQLDEARREGARRERARRPPSVDIGAAVRAVAKANPSLVNPRDKSGGRAGVYFLEMQCDALPWPCARPIKIGRARSIEARVRELQIASPWELRLLGWFPVDDEVDARDLEEELHHRFRKLRMRGEWFLADPDLLAFILTESKEP